MTTPTGFNQAARHLARNPLGIVALFIVLVYGIAALVLEVSSGALDGDERRLLVWFLVLFPVLVLLVFYRLVTAHHTKLYAPHDFHDDEGFFRALTPSEQKDRLDREVRELATQVTPPEKKGLVAVETEAAGVFRAPIRQAWILAEELAFRELEGEFGVPVTRQVAISGKDAGIDGVLTYKGRTTIIEIKFSRVDRLVASVRRAAEHLTRIAADAPSASFVIAVVVDGLQAVPESEKLKLNQLLGTFPISVYVRLYDFHELKQKYGIDTTDDPIAG